ncbi:MAG TPA: hypothetical protein PLU10_03205 [Chitinophagaceae bacterium]|nr:hypothetical protein [Chitinophagaceae bacterium]
MSNKLRAFFVACLLCATLNIWAQDIEIDKKTNMVKVDGVESFYLVPKNKAMMGLSDFALENLSHQELAYFKHETNANSSSDMTFFVVFTKTGNGCTLYNFNIFNVMKPLAKTIAAANLVEHDAISMEAERKFVVMHHGFFMDHPSANSQETFKAGNTTPPTANIPPAEVMIKDNKIYNHSELVGTFAVTKDETQTLVTVYTLMDAVVCKAQHENGNDEADWNVDVTSKVVTVLFRKEAPLEKLFSYLIEKGYL